MLSTLDLILYGIDFNLICLNRQFLIFLRTSYNIWKILEFKSISVVIFILENVLLKYQSDLDNHYNGMKVNLIIPALCLGFLKIASSNIVHDEAFSFVTNSVIPFSFKGLLTVFFISRNVSFFCLFKYNLNIYIQGRGMNSHKLIFFVNCFDKSSIACLALIVFDNLSTLILAYFYLDEMRVFVIFLSISGLMLLFTLISCVNEYKNSTRYFLSNYIAVISSISFLAFVLGYI